MSIEQRKVWQVIQYIDNINSGSETATQHDKAIAPPHTEEEDSFNHLIEETDQDEEEIDEEEDEDIISYESESSNFGLSTLMESPAAIPRPSMVLDLATGNNGTKIGSHELQMAPQQQNHPHVQMSPRLVYVKLGDSTDHVITVNRPMVEDLSRILSANAMVNMATGAAPEQQPKNTSTTTTNDEELTSLTWLQDKNLIQGKCVVFGSQANRLLPVIWVHSLTGLTHFPTHLYLPLSLGCRN